MDLGGIKHLVIDLDGTLIKGDSTVLMAKRFVVKRPFKIPLLALQLLKGRLAFKTYLAQHITDLAPLPYRPEILKLIESAKTQGAKVYLVSAAPHKTVTAIAAHLGAFDGAWGSAETNLKGHLKLTSIQNFLSHEPFAYAGDSEVDLQVWAHSKLAIIVHGSKQVLAAAQKLSCKKLIID
jgi:phosphoserine phosphatase